MDDFTLTNLELRESTPTGEEAAGLSHATMKGMVLLTVLEMAADGEPRGSVSIVHDAGDTGERYLDVGRALTRAGWAVALPDLRGHGRTEGERGHSAGLLEVQRDLGAIQDHLAYRMPDEPKILVGQGLGALQALSFAIECPGQLAALVLVSPLHEPAFVPPTPPGGLGRLLGKKLKDDAPGSIGWTAGQLVAGGDPALWEDHPQTHDVITLRAQEQAGEAARRYLPRLAEVDVPVLVIHGGQDPIASPELSQALVGEGVDTYLIENLFHHCLQGPGSEVAHAHLVEWLDRVLPR